MTVMERTSRVKLFLLLAIVTSFGAAYWPAFLKLNERWSGGDNNYCYLIPALFFYLCWELREVFRFQDFSWKPWGLALLMISLLLSIAGEYGSLETLVQAGIWASVVSIMATLYGGRIRYLLFPIIILFFIIPLPPFINNLLTFKLKMAASSLAVNMLRLSGISVFLEGNVIDLGIQRLQVVDACSGLRYFMPMILMALLVGYFFSPGVWRISVLLFLVMPLSVIVNAIRIWLTGMLTAHGYEKLAQSLFHDFSGWLMFMIAGVLLLAAAFALRRLGKPPAGALPRPDPGIQKVGKIQPLVITSFFCMLFLATGWAMAKNRDSYIIPPRKIFHDFPMTIGPWQGERGYLSKEILDSLWADDYVSAAYSRKDSRNIIYLLVPFYEYQGTQHTAHAPQSCLLGGGYSLNASEPRTIDLGGGKNIEVMSMILNKGEVTMLASYFFLQRGRVITNPWLNKWYLMQDAFEKNRTDGALVRAELLIPPGGVPNDAYEELDAFLAELWKILPEYVPQ